MDLHTEGGALIYGGKFVLGLGWTYTQVGCTYSWREVCVRFRMDLHTEGGALIHGGKFVLGLGWTYTQRGHLFMEGSLC